VLSQALDFEQETRVLRDLLQRLTPEQWQQPTQFKQWTPNDIMRHLHFWNEAADWSVHAPQALQMRLTEMRASAARGEGMRVLEGLQIKASGPILLDLWSSFALDMAERWRALDPRQRVDWAGPPMSVRSSITARQMETWAHGQAVFDLCGQDRPESTRLRNIVVLGVNTFGWSHQVRGWETPPHLPRIELISPDGEAWNFGEPGDAGLVRGSALGFAQVVTQTRHLGDTDLKVEGEVASRWMLHAQCFAGPPEVPPAAGLRRKSDADA
jgi:uncharacterized protein (TIGR03084 family)